jgi:methylated-DNA-[protein]-cysteine S-methyltransferase
MNIDCTQYASPLGRMWLAARGDALLGVWFDGQKHFAGREDGWRANDDNAVLRETRFQLDAYFAGTLRTFTLPLCTRGTAFQQAVWRAIAAVPYGASITYADLARDAGAARAVRAAGAATGRNPWTIVVPCHRIVGTRGALTGYAGGLARKRGLLRLEAGERARGASLPAGAMAASP